MKIYQVKIKDNLIFIKVFGWYYDSNIKSNTIDFFNKDLFLYFPVEIFNTKLSGNFNFICPLGWIISSQDKSSSKLIKKTLKYYNEKV